MKSELRLLHLRTFYFLKVILCPANVTTASLEFSTQLTGVSINDFVNARVYEVFTESFAISLLNFGDTFCDIV